MVGADYDVRKPTDRTIILVPMIHGHVINIGDMGNDLPDKFKRIKRAYREILPP